MTTTDRNFLEKLKTEKIPCSTIPKIIREADYFQNFVRTNIIVVNGNWKRGSIELKEDKRDYFEIFFNTKFSEEVTKEINRATNIKTLRNSKGRATESNAIIFLRGNQKVKINGLEVDLNTHKKNFGLFSVVLKELVCEKICFIENLHTFLNIEKLIEEDYIFVHTYGRVGAKLLDKIQTNEVLVFSDYDFVGLDEYLKFKEKFEKTTFFIPKNYDFLFEEYSRTLKDNKKETSQNPTPRVLESTEEIVTKIRQQVYETQRFLEQEIVILFSL